MEYNHELMEYNHELMDNLWGKFISPYGCLAFTWQAIWKLTHSTLGDVAVILKL